MNNTNLILSDESEKMKNRELLEEYFSHSLEMDLLLRLYPDDEDTLYQIVNLLVDTCATNRKLLHIAGDDKPAEVVRSRFMKLNADHIRFVLKCLAENSNPIRNMKQYLLASLYNAPTTMQLSYQNQTNHDLANADEFHLLLKEEQTAAYSVEIWKRFRKWGGIPTALTQNVKDLLASPEVSNIFENSDFVYMLNQANGDRQILAKQLNISPHQLSYVTHSGEGEGLLFFGNVILPFVDHFPKDLELYRILTTKLNEISEGAQK